MSALTRVEILVALACVVAFFSFCYFSPARRSLAFLICLIPFQPISSEKTSLNVFLVYTMGIAFALRGRIRLVPLGGCILAILGVYVVSAGFAEPSTVFDHLLFTLNLMSGFLLFVMVYNFVREEQDLALIVRTFIVLNVLVLLYCAAQTFLGRVSLFGLRELSIQGLRSDGRLQGPFMATGLLAEYFVLSILLFCYLLIHVKKRLSQLGLYALIGLNLVFLIATANRGGFLVLIGSMGWFLYMYRGELGVARAVGLAFSGTILLLAASLIVVAFTDFPIVYERLENTELSTSGVPDTRINTWSAIIPEIQNRLLLGHGPHFYGPGHDAPYLGFKKLLWPHNLYLFILFTVGVPGLIAWLYFFFSLLRRSVRAIRHTASDEFLHGLVRLGTIMIPVVLIDQIKIEFLRPSLIDYSHYLFATFGILLACADVVSRASSTRTSAGAAPALRVVGNYAPYGRDRLIGP
jgi:O-antigen ligase